MDRETPLVNHLFYGLIIFKPKTTFLQDLPVVWYVVLMFTNPLSGIEMSERQDKHCIEF